MSVYKMFHLEYVKRNPSFLTSEWFTEFCICKYIYEYYSENNWYPLIDEVVDEIKSIHGEQNIYYLGLKRFIWNRFGLQQPNISYECASLSDNARSTYEEILRIDELAKNLSSKMSRSDIVTQIQRIIERQDINLTELIALSFLLISDKNFASTDYYLALVYRILQRDEYKVLSEIDKYVSCVSEEHHDKLLCELTSDPDIAKICSMIDLPAVQDVAQLNERAVLGLFIFCYDEFLEVFKFLNMSTEEIFQSMLQKLVNLFTGLTSREERYLYDYYLNGFTLEQISNEDGLTRERVRQIIKKASLKLVNHSPFQHLGIYFMFLQSLANRILNGDYNARLCANRITKDLSDHALMLIATLYTKGVSDFDYALIVYLFNVLGYKVYKIGTKNGRVEYLSKYESNIKYLVAEEYQNLTVVDKQVVDKHFHKIGNYYLHNSVRLYDIVVYLCDQFFPEGIKLSNSNNQHLLAQKYEDIFGCTIDFSDLGRHSDELIKRGYILAGRGMYRNKSYCPTLDGDLLDEINKYIVDNAKPTLYYQMIYDHFKDQLLNLKINNYWLLKGLLDSKLPGFIIAHRDYVSNSDISSDTTAISEMRDFAHSFPRVFTIDDLVRRFKGISYPIFTNFLSLETKYGHLIALFNGRYIYYHNLGISVEAKEAIKLYVREFFKAYKSKSVNSSVLYSNLRTRDKSLLLDMREAGENHFALFSYLKELLCTEYVFRRPFISISEDGDAPSSMNLLLDFVADKEMFTKDELYSFMQYMDISKRYLIKLFDVASDTHVLIDAASMVRKEMLDISSEELDEIKTLLYTFTQRTGQLNTESFNGYSLFPKLKKYEWNKYLLSGLVRSYFSDIFDVENTKMGYIDTDFIVRRRK